MGDHRYKLLYKLEEHPEGVSKADVPAGMGACDAVLFCSLIYPEDGSFSLYLIGKDGRRTDGEDLDDNEWFKVWSMMAKRLGESKTLSEGKKLFAAKTFEAFRAVLLAERGRG